MITIIIPFFNAEKHLKKAINSILMQTYNNWELILIDDCSIDNSFNIAKKVSNNCDKIKLFSNSSNLGVDKSRFEGIKKANGQFLLFLDADDWLSPNSLRLLYDKIIEEKSDVVFGSSVKVLDKYGLLHSKPSNSYIGLLSKSISYPELFDKYFLSYFGVNYLQVTVWGKLYRADLIKSLTLNPSNMKMGEDLLFNMFLHPHLKKVSFVEDVVYYYRYGGMTTTSNPYFLDNIKKQYWIKREFAEKFSYQKAKKYLDFELVNSFYSHFENLILMENYNDDKLRLAIREELKDEIYLEVLEYKNDERNEYLATKNEEIIASKILKNAKKRKLVFSIKKIISKLLN